MYVQQKLVRDGTLVLSVDESLIAQASEWMPSLPEARAASHPSGPSIRVDRGELSSAFAKDAPALALGSVTAWVDATRTTAWLENDEQNVVATIDLESRIARVAIADRDNLGPTDVTSTLTIIAALLLVRDGRTAIHAAAVAHPASRKAWLLAGDSHSGKSTTTANLIRAGWQYLSDDYVVLSRSQSGDIEVEGWPDDFHLDEGWHRGKSTGVRGTLREEDLPEGRRVTNATLGGIFFPRVSADDVTAATAVPAVVSLERLIRQSPWLIADNRSAGRVFELLSHAASLPAGELRLGLDTFADAEKLSAIVTQFADSAR